MRVDYLRVSVTDRCNFNCIYCRPYRRVKIIKKSELLSFEEIVEFIKLTTKWGIRKVRLTGGEPLIRKDILKLINMIAEIKKIEDISITTNGTKLEEFAWSLRKAGLSRVNVSLDSLNKEKFAKITGDNKLSKVLKGIEIAKKVGLEPVKINVVVLKGINDDEVIDFVEFSQRNSLIVRFIEYMPMNGVGERKWYISNKIIKRMIEKRWGYLEPTSLIGNGPAKYFTVKGSCVPVGFISFTSHSFCEKCNRLRLTCEGKLKPCLISDFEVDIKNVLRDKDKKRQIKEFFDLAINFKRARKKKITPPDPRKAGRFMFQIGG